MTVPGDIISALHEAGEIPDPYYDRNELDLQWMGRDDWTMTRTFIPAAALLARKRVFLEIECLDTVAEISLNGKAIGHSANMFRRLRLDVKDSLKEGENVLSVLIKSPEVAAAAVDKTLRYPVPAMAYPVTSPHRNLIRKMQCMSGWDWGPCFLNGGIYDSVRLTGIDGPRIEYARVSAVREGKTWKARLNLELDALEECACEIGFSVAGRRMSERVTAPAGASTHDVSLDPGAVREWWPAGMGEPALYPYEVEVSTGENPDGAHAVSGKLGFRELTPKPQNPKTPKPQNPKTPKPQNPKTPKS